MSPGSPRRSFVEPTAPCRLCGSGDPLLGSHILPEFTYTPIYDERHKGYIVDPLDPRRARKFQKGLREHMLYRNCEQFLNEEYEKPFKALWFDQCPLAELDARDEALLRIPDYRRFKLFHLSVLLRAEVTTRREFSEVSLGPKHRARLLHMVRSGDPGEAHEYSIVCMAIRRPDDGRVWWDLLSSPNPGRVYGTRFYQFTFGGCGWLYFVKSHTVVEIEALALRPDGVMPVAKLPWAAIKRYAPHAKL